MKTLLILLYAANTLSATAQPPAPKDSVLFECPKCQGNMKLMVIGKGTNMTYERNSTDKAGTLFPIMAPLPPGDYEYAYWQNGVQQMHLLFKVKAGEKNVITVK